MDYLHEVEHMIRGVIDRQATEHTWEYAMLYDFRAVTNVTTLAQALGQLADTQIAGQGRRRGPIGLAIAPRPDDSARA